MHKQIDILGIRLDYYSDIEELYRRFLDSRILNVIHTPNPEHIIYSERHSEFKPILNSSDVNLPDGNGLLWAATFMAKVEGERLKVKGERRKIENSKLNTQNSTLKTIWIFITTYLCLVFNKSALRKVIPNVTPGSDTFFQIHKIFNERKTKILYLGGENGVEKEISVVMKRKYPNIDCVSIGGFPLKNPEDQTQIEKLIKSFQPEVVFVALDTPKQEIWINKNRELLSNNNVKIAMIVGGTFDFAVGRRKRAPQWMQNFQIEWLWRLIQQPQRVGRIWDAVFVFPMAVLMKAINS